ncbi:MAG: MFS transporter [Sphingomonadaceae bacterium]
MTQSGDTETGYRGPALFAPLQHHAFRRIWIASIPSNFGLLINSVGAGWAMTRLTDAPEMVALVQTALMLPYMLFAIPAGAIADTYDRRKVSLVALFMAVIFSSGLFILAWLGLLDPWLLLIMCFLNGAANAVFGPAWMSSVSEQVPRKDLPLGIALNAMSYNIARAFGPALGGFLVSLAGTVAAFGTNAVSYLPMIWAQLRWKRQKTEPHLPPEQIGTAILSGLRYVGHSPQMRRTLGRTIMFGIAGASLQALLPLVANQQLEGGASLYGLLLGMFGVGAVLGAWLVAWTREKVSLDNQITLALLGLAVITAGIALSHTAWLTGLLLLAGGMAWMQITNTLNISVQARAPRWVTGRASATFQASVAGGIALGSWLWGSVTEALSLESAIGLSALAMALVAVIGRLTPITAIDEADDTPARMNDPDIALDLNGRSGPVIITIEYETPPEQMQDFYKTMTHVRSIRMRNGAYGWSLSRDIAHPEKWLERFHTPTWDDYMRQRERMTEAERQFMVTMLGIPVSVRRLLERPVGSVRGQGKDDDSRIILPFTRTN